MIVVAVNVARRPKHHTFTLIQKKSNDACPTSTTCTVTALTAVGTNHVLVGYAWPSTTQTLTASASGAGTWIHSTSPSCAASTLGFGVDAVYILSTTSAAPTTISFVLSASSTSGWHVEVREYSFTGSSTQFDTCASASDTLCTTCAGVALTLSGANDVIVQAYNPAVTCSAITAPYGNLNTDGSGGVCSADSLNTTSGTAPNWTTVSGAGEKSGIAIKEITTVTCKHALMLLGAGCG